MKQLLLILSLTLGLASPVFAADYAGTILQKGVIIDKRLVTLKNVDGFDVQHLRVIAVYKEYVYDCWVFLEGKKGVSCTEIDDEGVN